MGPSAGHLDQPAQPCSANPTKPHSSIGFRPLAKVGLPCVSLSLSLPDGKEFCDLEGHTVPSQISVVNLRTRAGVQKAPRASTHPQPLGKEKILQKIRLARTLFTRLAGESCKPSGNGLEQETGPAQPAAPKVSAQHGKLMVALSE